jgi:hypothetical protein
LKNTLKEKTCRIYLAAFSNSAEFLKIGRFLRNLGSYWKRKPSDLTDKKVSKVGKQLKRENLQIFFSSFL